MVARLREFARSPALRRPATRARPATARPAPPRARGDAKELKAAGIRFVGPTTAYALMQAIGLVDDHLADCFVPPTRH